mgnify:CR=1 FL=1
MSPFLHYLNHKSGPSNALLFLVLLALLQGKVQDLFPSWDFPVFFSAKLFLANTCPPVQRTQCIALTVDFDALISYWIFLKEVSAGAEPIFSNGNI